MVFAKRPVIVIDPQPFAQTIQDLFRAERAEPGIDYTESDCTGLLCDSES